MHKELLRLPTPLNDALENLGVVRRYRDGAAIFRCGDDAHGLFGVRSGGVQMLGRDAHGGKSVLTVLAPAEWFGEISLIDGRPREVDAVSSGDSELWFVPKRELAEFLRTHPEFYLPVAQLLTMKIRMLCRLWEDTVRLDAEGRLATRVLELARNHGCERPGQGIAIDLHLSHENLAAMIGTTRETVGRHLKRWERLGWVKVAYGRLLIRSSEDLVSLI